MTVIHTLHTVDNTAWDAGASLIESMALDGAFVFTVGQSIGIVCGLTATDLDAFYGKISHAFWIETGRCKVMESGSSKTGFYATTPATIYKIERVQSTVRYYTDGVLRYTSLVPSTGTVLLDSSLYSYNDTIATAECVDYDGNIEGDTAGLVFPALLGWGIADSAYGYGRLTFPAFTGFGEVAEGHLLFPALTGSGFDADGMGRGWLAELAGIGVAADGEGAVALGPFTGFGVEDGVFYGTGTLAALTGLGFEIYDRPDFNQGRFDFRALRGYGADYPELDGDGTIELPLWGRGTDTDLIGSLTFPALRMEGALLYNAKFNIPINLNLQGIAYNSAYETLEGSDALTGGITAAAILDQLLATGVLTGLLQGTAARSDIGYAADTLNSAYEMLFSDSVTATDPFGANDWTAVATAFVGETDEVLFSGVLASVLASTTATTDTVIGSEQESADFVVAVTDGGVAQETLLGPLSLWADTTDGIVLSEARNQDWAISGVSDQAEATDAVNAAYEVAEANTGVASDVSVLQLDLVGTATETVSCTVTLGYSAQETGPCNEALTISEVLTLPIHQHAPALADTPTAADTLVLLATEYAPKTDTATVAETLASVIAYYAPLTDTATATGALSSTSGISGVLADTLYLAEQLAESTQTLYVVNADTGAVSTYVVAPVVAGMTQYHDTLYVAGPQGLYALDATTDAGTAITWTVETGFSNWGTDLLKRVLDVNLQARIQDDTNLVLVADRYGQKQSYRYRLPALTRDSYRDGVVKPGKGIQSVYWQLVLQGENEAEIDQLRVRLEPLSRRR